MVGGVIGRALGVACIDENGPAAGGGTGIDITPAVSYHKAAAQIYAVDGGIPQQHARLGLAALAALGISV